MGNWGFSYVGFLYLLMLTVPNLLWAKNQPKHYSSKNESRLLLWLERIGQVCVTFTALVFSDFNIRAWSVWNVWLITSAVAMILYECWWVRYFRSNKTLADFYGSFYGVPVPGATLPVIAFFLLGIYGKVVWLLISVTILGIGHIGIHLQHRKEIQQ